MTIYTCICTEIYHSNNFKLIVTALHTWLFPVQYYSMSHNTRGSRVFKKGRSKLLKHIRQWSVGHWIADKLFPNFFFLPEEKKKGGGGAAAADSCPTWICHSHSVID